MPATPKDFVSDQSTSPSSMGHSPFQSHTQNWTGQVVEQGLVAPAGSLQLDEHQSLVMPSIVEMHMKPEPYLSFSNPTT